jgi:hypothetical protein
VARAADIRPSLELRNEAIACLALTDLRPLLSAPTPAPSDSWIVLDRQLERYVRMDDRGMLHLHRIADGTELFQLPDLPSSARPQSYSFSPDGRRLLQFREAESIRVTDLAGRKVILQFPANGALLSCAFTADSRSLMSGYHPGRVIWHDLATGQTNLTLITTNDPYGLSLSPDGKKLAVMDLNSNNVDVVAVPVREAAGIETAMMRLGGEASVGLIVPPDPTTNTFRQLIVELAARYRLSAIHTLRAAAADGALMSYGVDVPALHRQAAVYVDRILRGEKPADLPVQQPTKFELVINLKTAKALGLTLPATLLFQADEVIQ